MQPHVYVRSGSPTALCKLLPLYKQVKPYKHVSQATKAHRSHNTLLTTLYVTEIIPIRHKCCCTSKKPKPPSSHNAAEWHHTLVRKYTWPLHICKSTTIQADTACVQRRSKQDSKRHLTGRPYACYHCPYKPGVLIQLQCAVADSTPAIQAAAPVPDGSVAAAPDCLQQQTAPAQQGSRRLQF